MILPVGMENFSKIIENKLDFVDKTLFIKEILDDKGTDVAVITRPRRFGKTLNLSMLRYFFANEVLGQATKGLFDGLKISHCGEEYLQHQGKYPVISISFKDIKKLDYESAKSHLALEISMLYSEHRMLLTSDKLSKQDQLDFEKILKREGSEDDLQLSLKNLCRYIYIHYGIKPWLLIDEYDTPIQSAYSNKYYEPMINLMRGLLSATLKSNDYLKKGVITGILRIAKESLFSGVNNLEVYSILRGEYSEQFGFTEEEVEKLFIKANMTEKLSEVKQWYNGYQIGETVIYNPWSIVNCIKQKGNMIPYWVNTSDNQLIKDLLKESPMSFKQEFESLLKGNYLEKLIDSNLVFQYLNNNPSSVWSLLLMSGYLKPVTTEYTYQGTICQLTIPNMEVHNLYRQIIEQWLSNGHGIEWYNQFIAALVTGKIDDFKKQLESVIIQITSYHDFAKEPEAFYQGLILGFTASLHNAGTYEIKSNRESGLGRFDIMLLPKDPSKLGIILELKTATAEENLLTVAENAIKQIDAKKYTEEFSQRGIANTIKIGIGFCGKAFELCAVKGD